MHTPIHTNHSIASTSHEPPKAQIVTFDSTDPSSHTNRLSRHAHTHTDNIVRFFSALGQNGAGKIGPVCR